MARADDEHRGPRIAVGGPGWQLAGIITLQTGNPFTPTTADNTGGAVGTQRPNVLGDWRVPNPGPEQWFDRNAFCWQAGCGFAPLSFGNAGRNILTGPPLKKWDFALMKSFSIRDDDRLQFRAELFNFTNYPNFFLPAGRVDLASAGTINQAGPGRTVQLGLKYIF